MSPVTSGIAKVIVFLSDIPRSGAGNCMALSSDFPKRVDRSTSGIVLLHHDLNRVISLLTGSK